MKKASYKDVVLEVSKKLYDTNYVSKKPTRQYITYINISYNNIVTMHRDMTVINIVD